MDRYTLTVVFKNGLKVELDGTDFHVKALSDGEILGITWEGLKGPVPLYFRLSEIVSVVSVKQSPEPAPPVAPVFRHPGKAW